MEFNGNSDLVISTTKLNLNSILSKIINLNSVRVVSISLSCNLLTSTTELDLRSVLGTNE